MEKKISIIEKYDESTNFTVEKNTFCNHVMMNLLSNAIKFSEENGEIHIDVKSHKEEVELIVKDKGIGMLEEDIEIFKIVSKDELKLNNLWLQDKETDIHYNK